MLRGIKLLLRLRLRRCTKDTGRCTIYKSFETRSLVKSFKDILPMKISKFFVANSLQFHDALLPVLWISMFPAKLYIRDSREKRRFRFVHPFVHPRLRSFTRITLHKVFIINYLLNLKNKLSDNNKRLRYKCNKSEFFILKSWYKIRYEKG